MKHDIIGIELDDCESLETAIQNTLVLGDKKHYRHAQRIFLEDQEVSWFFFSDKKITRVRAEKIVKQTC